MRRFDDSVCVQHMDVAADFYCSECRLFFCDRCVAHEFEGQGFVDRCRRCRHPVQARPRQPDAGASGFVSRLGEIVRFPISPGVPMILLGLAIIAGPIAWLARGIVGAIIAGGIELSVFFYLVNQCAAGNDRHELRGPDFRSAWDDVIGPLERLMVALAPLIVVLIWISRSLGGISLSVIAGSTMHLAALIGALLLLPLLLALAALGGTPLTILNPAEWSRALRQLGSPYWLALPIFYVLLAGYASWDSLVAPMLLGVPLAGRLVGLLVGYAFMAMAAKLFGLLLEPHFASARR